MSRSASGNMTPTTPSLRRGLHLLVPFVAVLAAGACQERELILPGERLEPRQVVSPDGPAIEGAARATGAALSLPAQRANSDWTHRAGNASHNPGHVALGAGQSLQFATPIGAASDRRYRITADPVVAGGLVFAMDSMSRVTAVNTSGQTVWSMDLTPARERTASVSGGGLAYGAGRVIVTTGFGEVVALDAGSGGVVWRHRLNSPASGSPTVSDNTVFVLGRDGTAWSLDLANGRENWQVRGRMDFAGWQGYGSPAVEGDLVVIPTSSGQLIAVDRKTGAQRWSGQVAGQRVGRAISVIRDMTGEPVISGNMVIAGTSAGRIAAFDRVTGMQLWSHGDGALSAPVVAGNGVFAIDDDSRLIRLERGNGARVWAVDLPQFVDTKVKKQEQVWAHFGPVLAGGRLIVASSDGILRMFDPASGNLVGQAQIPGGAATAVSVAGGTIYLTSRNGQLLAYR